jgi:hypothetical protein
MKTTRRNMVGKQGASMAGMSFYDIDFLDTISFCPDSNDASTPATQVHQIIQLKGVGAPSAPLIARFSGAKTLDALIEALIEHRTYVFGRSEWRTDFQEQPQEG